MGQFQNPPAPSVDEFNEAITNLITSVSLTVTNASDNRLHAFKIGKRVFIYGTISFGSTSATITAPINKLGQSSPFLLFGSTDITAVSFASNATTISLSGLTAYKFYNALCMYETE